MTQKLQDHPQRTNNIGPVFWGVIAILGGVLLIAGQFVELDTLMPWVTLGLGLAMLAYGVLMRTAAGLIPGGIVTGVGLGLTVLGTATIDSGERGAGMFLIFLALGFLSIPVTTRLLTDEMHWWAFIPGGIIFLVGLALMFGGAFMQALNLMQIGGALALVGLGAWLIYQFIRRKE